MYLLPRGAERVYIAEQNTMIDNPQTAESVAENLVWFAMSATYCRELKAKSFLESKSVECFVPMKYEIVKDRRRGKIKKLIPAIHNLIFVHTTKERIQTLKAGVEYLQYMTKPEGGRNIPIVVPDEQMQQFITTCNTHDEKLTFLSPDEVKLSEGVDVKIIGGAFDGIVGKFVKVEGKRKKRVVVSVQGITDVMLAEITDGYLQVIE